jgi:hypothetical protein
LKLPEKLKRFRREGEDNWFES